MQGVDSLLETSGVEVQAQILARKLACIIVITGATDIITDGKKVAYVHEGHPMMGKVTAMGCAATGIIGAFLSVNPNPFDASVHAMKAMGIAGEKAGAVSRGNGSMMVNFLDELCNLAYHE